MNILQTSKSAIVRTERLGVGIIFCLLCFLSSSLMGVLVKFIGSETTTSVIVFIQNAISLVLTIPFLLYFGLAELKTKRIKMHFFRAITGSITWYCFFIAIPIIDLTNATLFLYSAPLWMPILGFIFFKEKVNSKVWIGVFIGFIGIFLVLHPGKYFFRLGDLIVLAGAIFLSFAFFSIGWLRKTESILCILFYYFALSSVLFFPLALYNWQSPSTALAWAGLIGIGVCMALSQFFITLAYQFASPIKLSPYIYSIIIFTALLNWLLWGAVPTLWEAIGIVAVISGGIIAMLAK